VGGAAPPGECGGVNGGGARGASRPGRAKNGPLSSSGPRRVNRGEPSLPGLTASSLILVPFATSTEASAGTCSATMRAASSRTTSPPGRLVWPRVRAIPQRMRSAATASMLLFFCHPLPVNGYAGPGPRRRADRQDVGRARAWSLLCPVALLKQPGLRRVPRRSGPAGFGPARRHCGSTRGPCGSFAARTAACAAQVPRCCRSGRRARSAAGRLVRSSPGRLELRHREDRRPAVKRPTRSQG
jgi:hypothetical protein